MDLTQKWSHFCLDCNSKKLYSEGYDTYYCKPCNKWLEEKCSDVYCEYCARRPLTPDVENINQP